MRRLGPHRLIAEVELHTELHALAQRIGGGDAYMSVVSELAHPALTVSAPIATLAPMSMRQFRAIRFVLMPPPVVVD